MQLNHFPLVKTFEIDDKIYLYDAHSNFLCELDSKGLHWFEKFSNNKVNALSEFWQKGIFLPDIFDEVVGNNSDISKMINEHSKYVLPRKLILEITENCNLRCSYCFNTIGVGPRKHSEIEMTKSIVYKAIDQYFKAYTEKFSQIHNEYKDRYLDIAPPNFGWWGGEPLLSFDIIQESFFYIKNLPWDVSDRVTPYC